MRLPDFLQKYREEAEKNLTEGWVTDIEFSGPTYQVQVSDKKAGWSVWAFLQLDAQGQVKDCFCSCEEAEQTPSCIHLATALLYLYKQHAEPLHVRFEHSFWNQLCLRFAGEWGYDSNILGKQKNGDYIYLSPSGKPLLTITPRTAEGKAFFRQILEKRPKETEETSLKFSNLSEEEIRRWRQGRPSFMLRYELSFWSDIAKWLMRRQDEGAPYTITFDTDAEKVPNHVTVSFPDATLSFRLNRRDLNPLIPSLNTVDSSLKVYDSQEASIGKIRYDRKKGTLTVTPAERETTEAPVPTGISIDGWLYNPDKGFTRKEGHPLLQQRTLSGRKVDEALEKHHDFIAQQIIDEIIHKRPREIRYTLSFDADWNLRIASYLNTPGDLERPLSRSFGKWVYIEGEGFFSQRGGYFDVPSLTVPAEEVASFIQQHRIWLGEQKGFKPYISKVEAQIGYSVDTTGRLTFTHQIAGATEGTHDFGPWLYVRGEGFHAKSTTHQGLSIKPGMGIAPEHIPLFIRNNRVELQMIPCFFSDKCPLEKVSLKVYLDENERAWITPHQTFAEGYSAETVRCFDDTTYVEGEGFYELPPNKQLPDAYRYKRAIMEGDLAHFLSFELPSLSDFPVEVDPRLTPPPTLDLHGDRLISKGRGEFGMQLFYVTERGEKIAAIDLWEALQKKKRFFFSPHGLIDLHLRRYNWLRKIEKGQFDKRSGRLTLSTLALIRLHLSEGISFDKPQDIKRLETLMTLHAPEAPDLTGLTSQLRGYQSLGLQWLWFLYSQNLSGLLCDDMGLGKTHQTMALLATVANHHKQHHESTSRHFLIICPTSVIYHWQEKLKEHLPGMRVCTFHGSKRSLGDFKKDYDILLTSYGIWRIEQKLLSQIPFEIAIFDEIQIAKNYSSRIHQALLNVKAEMRLGLTGTPIENYLRELKTLFDLVLPGYMPGETEYRERFTKPIEQRNDIQRRQELSRLIKPFILRRKKGDVLSDLPPKTEEIAYCELMPKQRALYLDILERRRQQILDNIKNRDGSLPYIHIFALLSSLKQVCNHPASFLKIPDQYKEFDSGKWELFLELLAEARESQQKVVIFSQYLGMMDIIENYLSERGIEYASVRGSTVNRAEQIHLFNRDPSCEVFVGSLHAVGLGIDLTAGSVVIHYDRWWNAAREEQATDRVHRIGQQRGVQVFKLVTVGTFEEKIDRLIAKKGKLMEEVIGVDDHQIIKQFTRDEIIELLENPMLGD